MQTIVETWEFIRHADRLGLDDEELVAIKIYIAANPSAGDVVPGSGGARKVRFPVRGKGKRGGYRVITFYTGNALPVFLLDIYSKRSKSDLTSREIGKIRSNIAGILRQYLE